MKVTSPILDRSPRLTDEADAALMARLRGDDDGALNVIVQRYRDPLVLYALQMVKTLDTAEEIVQETFVRIWEIRKRWTGGGSVQAYLYQTARNLALTRARHLEVRRRTRPEIQRTLLESREPSPLEEALEKEVLEALRAALDTLPPRRREALVLVRLHGLTLEEAAGRMGLSRQTVANHISLALDDLEVVLRDFRD